MEKPKCKLCGERHWSRETCKAAGKPVKIAMAEPMTQAIGIAVSSEAISREIETAIPPPKKRAARGTFDRNAYQRELMRKRRAAQKPS